MGPQQRPPDTTAPAPLPIPDIPAAKAHPRLTPNRNVLDDACDLPSTGCESYLAN
jgi:hypothetical protein